MSAPAAPTTAAPAATTTAAPVDPAAAVGAAAGAALDPANPLQVPVCEAMGTGFWIDQMAHMCFESTNFCKGTSVWASGACKDHGYPNAFPFKSAVPSAYSLWSPAK